MAEFCFKKIVSWRWLPEIYSLSPVIVLSWFKGKLIKGLVRHELPILTKDEKVMSFYSHGKKVYFSSTRQVTCTLPNSFLAGSKLNVRIWKSSLHDVRKIDPKSLPLC